MEIHRLQANGVEIMRADFKEFMFQLDEEIQPVFSKSAWKDFVELSQNSFALMP